MASRVPIRGKFDLWFSSCLGLFFVFLFFGLIGLCASWRIASYLLALGFLAGIAAAVLGVLLYLDRRYLEPTQNGFIIHGRARVEEYEDRQISDYRCQTSYTPGSCNSVNRWATLVMNAGKSRARYDFFYTFPATKPDPLGDLLGRLLHAAVERNREKLNAGRPINGEGWTLNSLGLTFGQRSRTEMVRFENMSAVRVVEDRLCIWERGNPHARVRIPIGSLNAEVLAAVLVERIGEVSQKPDEEILDEPLGRVIFERNKSTEPAILVATLAIAAGSVLGGVALYIFGMVQRPLSLVLCVGGVVLAAFGAWLGLHVWKSRTNIYRFHERGVTRTTTHGAQELLYEEVGSLTWWATRVLENGAYVTTTFNMILKPRRGLSRPTIRHFESVHEGTSPELERLRDFLSATLAEKMMKQLRAGHRVPWTSHLAFLPDGLEYRPEGKARPKAAHKVAPYNTIEYTLEKGVLSLSLRGKGEFAREKVDEENFWPGLAMLDRLTSTGAST